MKTILTGDRPTGDLHLGHYIGSLQNRINLMDEYDTFIIIADVQALSTNFDQPKLLRENIYKVLANYLAVGLDPEKATIFVQSQVPEITELTLYYGMLVSVASLQQNPTIKSEIQAGYIKDLSYGFLGYPVNQAADISIFKADLVPVGMDQVPHIEQTRRIVRKFNTTYGTSLVEPEAKVSAFPTLPGINGDDKMSKSLGNAIYLCDSDKEIIKKLKAAKTDPARITVEDKGHPEVCTVFKYIQAFAPGDIKDVETKCREGKWGCGHCKKQFTERLISFISPIRDKYEKFTADRGYLNETLKKGCDKARAKAGETMSEVREAMSIKQF